METNVNEEHTFTKKYRKILNSNNPHEDKYIQLLKLLSTDGYNYYLNEPSNEVHSILDYVEKIEIMYDNSDEIKGIQIKKLCSLVKFKIGLLVNSPIPMY